MTPQDKEWLAHTFDFERLKVDHLSPMGVVSPTILETLIPA